MSYSAESATAYDAYLHAWKEWVSLWSPNRSEKSGNYALEPVKTVHGIRYIDRNSHGYFEVIKRANGAPAFYFNNRDFVPLINGRSELRQAINDMDDGNFFNKS